MKPQVDDYRLPPFQELAGFERYDSLEQVVDRAERDGVLAPLPGSKAEERREEAVPSRIATVRTRLYLLGYLGKDNGSPVIDGRLQQAIGEFQREAGLVVDQWVGEETWGALQELVSFESATNLERWTGGGQPGRALERAINLRLRALGFLESRQPKKREKTLRARDRFVIAANLLRLTVEDLEPSFSLATLSALFDQDAIAERLSKAEEAFAFSRPLGVSKRTARSLLRRLIVSSAKIELWLLGFDVALDGKVIFKRPETFPYTKSRFRFYHALRSFWKQSGRGDKTARELARSVTGELFRALLRVKKEADDDSDPRRVEQLYETLSAARPADRDRVWAHIRSIGSRIWDGVKRAWRWFKALIKRTARTAVQWARNLARLAYRYAASALAATRGAIIAAVRAVAFILEKTVPDSDPTSVVITRDGDFDYYVFLSDHPDPATVDRLLQDLKRQSETFRITIRALGLLIETVIATMKKTALLGWFGLILALVRVYAKFKDLVDELGQVNRARAAA